MSDLAGDCFVVEIRRADHGKDLTRRRFDRDQSAVVRFFVSQQTYLFIHQPLGFVLER